MRDQVREKGETEEARAETGTGKAAVRRNREEKERKNRRLSSWKRKTSGRKKVRRKWKRPEVRTKGKHLWNSCGSEAGKSEKKRTAKPSTRTWKEDMRDQVGEKGGDRGSESGDGHWESSCEAEPGREGKEEQRLSSQNPKLRRTKESGNSGGQKAERKR